LQEKEWFANRRPEIADAANAATRKRLISALKTSDPALFHEFQSDSRKAEGEGHLLRSSGRHPLCGRGDVNLYAVFAETMRTVLNAGGRSGCVLPTGIATDDTTKHFFQNLMETRSLVSLFDFENRGVFFPGVHNSFKFCLFTASGSQSPQAQRAEFVFFANSISDLTDDGKRFTLSIAELNLLNPVSKTCPVVPARKDLTLLLALHRQGSLLEGGAWDGYYIRLIHLDDHRDDVMLEECPSVAEHVQRHERVIGGEHYSAVWEPKLMHLYDHSFATFQGVSPADTRKGKAREVSIADHENPDFVVLTRYWVRRVLLQKILGQYDAQRGWLLGYRDIARSTDARTCIVSALPETATTVSLPCIGVGTDRPKASLLANLSTLVLDYIVRLKVPGTHLTYGILKQLPILSPPQVSLSDTPLSTSRDLHAWLRSRVLELSYTAWGMQGIANDCYWNGPPFRWDTTRRFRIQCELDAAFMHMYLPATPEGGWRVTRGACDSGHDASPEQLAELKQYFPLPRDAVEHILETFPIVKRKDEAEHGEYRTKRVILEIYDAMQESMRTGQPWRSPLEPPPGPPTRPDGSFVDYAEIADNPPPHIHPPRSEA